METTQSVYSYDASQGHGQGHDEIYMHGGDGLRPGYDQFKYRSDRASASINGFFKTMDDEREEKGIQYSNYNEKSDNGVGFSRPFVS